MNKYSLSNLDMLKIQFERSSLIDRFAVNQHLWTVLVAMLCWAWMASLVWGQNDVAGSKDNSFIGRVPNYYIAVYETTPQESFRFQTGKDSDETISGTKTYYEYKVKTGKKAITKTEVFQYFFKMVQAKGGTIPFEDLNDNVATFKSKDGKTYAALTLWDQGAKYDLTIIQVP
jgi:hypothetical protein